jgi:triacylglycerol esterase/lipase EstA (alpha/beta hydrolase family)
MDATSSAFLSEQGPPPPNANNPACHLSFDHPEPIILVPGTFETMYQNWASLSPLIAKKGYCVYSLNYGYYEGIPATGPIEDSAVQLKTFVDQVMVYTGAKKVSLVGHSQGGMMPRYYIKFLGGDQTVDKLIGLVPSNHGTQVSHLVNLTGSIITCPACTEQGTGSDFLTKLNQGDETPGHVTYTVISTRYDEIVVPYTSAFLSNDPGEPPVQGTNGAVTNITLQDYFPLDLADHIQISYNLNAFKFVLEALEN